MRYVAFFKGINVGGRNIIKMSELRQLFIDLGYQDVKTYMQSGNVVFSTEAEIKDIICMISREFTDRFKFDSEVVIRDHGQMVSLIRNIPGDLVRSASECKSKDNTQHLYVCLFNRSPRTEYDGLHASEYLGDDIVSIGDLELYLFCRVSIRTSKIYSKILKIDDEMTVRNFSTIEEVYSLM
jgi:uncharacterized protein (DUF1697 family)